MKLKFCSLSSGSSGNCYYIGNEFHGILIDAGISASTIRKFLKDMDISMQTIMGVLITHNHTDHIRGLEVLIRKNSLPAFATHTIWESILLLKRKYPATVSVKLAYSKSFTWQVLILRLFGFTMTLLKQ